MATKKIRAESEDTQDRHTVRTDEAAGSLDDSQKYERHSIMQLDNAQERGKAQKASTETPAQSDEGESSALGPAAAAPSSAAAAPSSAAAAEVSQAPQPLEARLERYLIKSRMIVPQGLLPADIGRVEQTLGLLNARIIQTTDLVGTSLMSSAVSGPDRMIVAEMSVQSANVLAQNNPANLIVELDLPMFPAQSLFTLESLDPGIVVPHGAGFQTTIAVTGNGAPVQGAQVMLLGSVFSTQGTTDSRGLAQLTISGEDPDTINGLFVQPVSDYWNFWQQRPLIRTDQPNLVSLTPLSAFGDRFPNFPNTQTLGWGQRAMRLDQISGTYRGRGIRIAIIDSGLATTHRDFPHVTRGINITGGLQNWSQDEIGHGSHCAGIITAADNARGIRGFAPEAEIHILKYFPGGFFSHLVAALDYCIRNDIDVVNMSLGSRQRSDAVEEAIAAARQVGVACIVAAANVPGGGPVQFPGTSPNVLTVAAIGKTGEFPQNTWHSNEVLIGDGAMATSDGFFSTRFTCFGPEVDVCAPGLAIVSCVPPDNYLAMDGTSMATPHITGLAALILAHHPDFQAQGPFARRDSRRVERLFEILRQSAHPMNVGNVQRTGAGMPDAVRAFEIAAAVPSSPAPTPTNDELLNILRTLLALLTSGTQATMR